MTRQSSPSRVVLVADRRPETDGPSPVTVRRYRLARLRLDSRATDPEARFEHLKRVYD